MRSGMTNIANNSMTIMDSNDNRVSYNVNKMSCSTKRTSYRNNVYRCQAEE
jgi:hypothetical protein